MNGRRIIYTALIAFLAIYLYNSVENTNILSDSDYRPLKEELILKNLPDNEIMTNTPEDTILYEVYFPITFNGDEGEIFYLSAQKQDKLILHQYQIEKDEVNKRLIFVWKDSYDNLKIPRSKFNIYQYENGHWRQID